MRLPVLTLDHCLCTRRRPSVCHKKFCRHRLDSCYIFWALLSSKLVPRKSMLIRSHSDSKLNATISSDCIKCLEKFLRRSSSIFRSAKFLVRSIQTVKAFLCVSRKVIEQEYSSVYASSAFSFRTLLYNLWIKHGLNWISITLHNSRAFLS